MIIEDVSTKEVNTKFGLKPTYSLKADGTWYSFGFKKPATKIGDEVQFTFTESTYGKAVDAASFRVIAEGKGSVTTSTPAAPSAAPTGRYGPPVKPFPIPPLHGDRAIVRQNSVTNAVNLFLHCTDEVARNNMLPQAVTEHVLVMARMLEAYSCGDIEAAAAQEGT